MCRWWRKKMLPTTTLREDYDETSQQGPDRGRLPLISGAFFFGAAASIGAVLERIGDAHRNLIIDFLRLCPSST